ncbi:MAG: DUF1849 family protein [Alphaproteobacteria bacterium]|nr:DUF1849 family protein [Alphaproteobacteria bacterium]
MFIWSLCFFLIFSFSFTGKAEQVEPLSTITVGSQGAPPPASIKENSVQTSDSQANKTSHISPTSLPSAPLVASIPSSTTPSTSALTSPSTIAPPAGVFKLLPHRAKYAISLDKNFNDEDIADAKGQMTIQLAKVGDGWAIEQKSTLHIYYKDGSAEQVITTLATYESLDGLKYSFTARTLRGEQEECISGEAILASKGGAGIVTYQQPEESTIQLPVGTIFPTQHLINILTEAQKGKKVVSNIVFDGSSETHEPVLVDTVIGPSQDSKLALTNKELFPAQKVWPMRMGIYALDSSGPDPDYEIMEDALPSGVISRMTLDYGTFKVSAVLNQVEVFS